MPRLRLVLIAVGGSCDLARERDGRGLRNDRRYRVCHRRVAERRFDGPLLKVRNTAILPVSGARAGRSGIGASFPFPLALAELMSEVKGRGSDLAFRLTAGRFLVIVIGCTGSEMER